MAEIIQGQEKVVLRAVSPDNNTTTGDMLEVFATDGGETGVRVSGNLTVTGTTTFTVNTTALTVSDPFIELIRNNSGTDLDGGIYIQRGGAGNNAVIYWDEGDDVFKVATTTNDANTSPLTNSTLHQLRVGEPSAGSDAATKTYVDAEVSASTSMKISGDDSNTFVLDLVNGQLEVHGQNGISTATDSAGVLTITLADSITVNNISSPDSARVTIDEGLDVQGEMKAESVTTSVINTTDSAQLNIQAATVSIDGQQVIDVGGGDTPPIQSNGTAPDHFFINVDGALQRIPTGSIPLSRFNNDAGFGSASGSGFTNSTLATYPIIINDSTPADYSESALGSEPDGVGTGPASVDALGGKLGAVYDCTEPSGSATAADFGSGEAHVGA